MPGLLIGLLTRCVRIMFTYVFFILVAFGLGCGVGSAFIYGLFYKEIKAFNPQDTVVK